MQHLNNSVRDADALVQVLSTYYQFDAAQIVRLYNAEAAEKDIYKELKRLAVTLGEDDNLVIYFAGHGIFDSITGEGFWLPADAVEDEEGSFIGNDKIVRYLRAIKAKHIFLMSDACFSGSLLAGIRDFKERVENLPSRWVLTSGRNEVVSDGKPGTHSPFSTAVLEFLKKNNTKSSAVSDLVQYVKKQVAKATDNKQVPLGNSLFIKEDKGGEFIFHPREEVKTNLTRTDFRIHDAQLSILYSDITKIEAQVYVSSDDENLSMRGGVSEAIRKAAGRKLRKETELLRPAKLGEVVVTSGGESKADYIFHCITIDHESGQRVHADKVESLTQACLETATELGLNSIAFPALATGVARNDFEEVATAMVDTIGQFLLKNSNLSQVTIALKGRRGVTRKGDLYRFYQKAVARAAIINQLAETYENLRILQKKLSEDNDILKLLPLIQDMQGRLGAVEKVIQNKEGKSPRKQTRELRNLMSNLTESAFTLQETSPLLKNKTADIFKRTKRSMASTLINLNKITTNKISL